MKINISDHIHSQFRRVVERFSYTYSLSNEDTLKIMNCLIKFYEQKSNKGEK